MKAITVQQPWAWAIFRAGKDVENRADRRGEDMAVRRWNALGPRLVHTSQRDAGEDAFHTVKALSPVEPGIPGMPTHDPSWAYGAVIGVVTVAGVHGSRQCWDYATDRLCSPWAQPNAAHLVLTDARLFFRGYPARGQLGSWDVTDPGLLERVRRELAR